MSLKGKKIVCFVALPHHTRFLWPITAAAEAKGAKIIYFTTMSDFPFEGDLIKKGKECKILQKYVSNDVRDKIERASVGFYETWFQKCFQWDGMRHWPFVQQTAMIYNGFEECFCFEEFIKAEQPDLFLALHERNRWGKIIGHFAAKYGIPYITLQEGDYYEDRLSFSGHTEYSTALLLWGRGIEERLSRMKSAPEKFVLVGNTHLASIRKTFFKEEMMAETRRELNIPPGKKVVLFLVGIQWGVVKDAPIWEELLSGIGDDVVKIFKWHPKVTYYGFKNDIEKLFKEKFPSCIVLHNYDPYRLLPIADYSITLGKTTLAVEALSFGTPLFSLPGRDGEIDHYAEWGISQPLWPPGNYNVLYKTIKEGVPQKIKEKVTKFLEEDYFYKNNTMAIERAVEVLDYAVECKRPQASGAGLKGKEHVAGRVSFIIPSGGDQEALLSTLTALSQNVRLPDWEVVIVVNDDGIRSMLSALSGDLKVVDAEGSNLAKLYNKGAECATGEYLIFMKPGIVYFKDEGLLEAMKGGVAGISLKNADMTPYCLGIGFNFNHVLYYIKDAGSTREAVGGGLIGLHRKVFDKAGGFDEGIANDFTEADICLSAKDKGYSVTYLPDCLGVVFKESFTNEAMGSDSEEEWKGRIRLFAKWCGKLPKDDDYIKFAGDLLKV
jgi:hypothetical protein